MPHRHPSAPALCRPRGFTFVEILAAMLFMAVLVPVAVDGILIANRAGVVAERKRRATALANDRLTEQIVTGEWRTQASQAGDFGADWPGFTWKLSVEPWQDATMQVVTVEVGFRAQERDYAVALSTLAPTTEPAESETTQTGGTQTP